MSTESSDDEKNADLNKNRMTDAEGEAFFVLQQKKHVMLKRHHFVEPSGKVHFIAQKWSTKKSTG